MNLDLYIVKTKYIFTYYIFTISAISYHHCLIYIHGYMPLEHYFIWYTHKLFVLLYWHWTPEKYHMCPFNTPLLWTNHSDHPAANWNGITPGNHAMRQN